MKPSRIVLIPCFFAALILAACIEIHSPTEPWEPIVVASGPRVTENREVSGFDAIEVSGAGQVILELTGQESLTVTAEASLLPHIRTEVINGRLVLGPEPGIDFSSRQPILYRVTARELQALELSGASTIEAHRLDAPQLDIRASGASMVSGAGRVDRLVLSFSGASRFDGGALPCRDAEVRLSGASFATVRVSELLRGSVSGASTLEYYGRPDVEVTVSGGSRVRGLD